MPAAPRDPLDVALRALARRELTVHELVTKLMRSGVSRGDAEEVAERLRAAGYLDDERAAHERARVLAQRGRGDEAIRMDLRSRGVGEDVVTEAVAALSPERVRAERVAGRRGGGPAAAKALLRAGFSEETIAALLGATVADDARTGVGFRHDSTLPS